MAQLALNKMKTMVEVSSTLTVDARHASERDRDYYDDHQWTHEEISTLRRRKQPIITINRIKRKVDAMVGIEQRMRVDPKALPREPEDEGIAEAATKALVFVDDNTRFDQMRSMVFENAVIEGYGGVEIVVEEKRGRLEIKINRIRWEEILFDPHSREKDFSDATYIGVNKWMSLDTALEMYRGTWKGSEEELQTMLEASLYNTAEGETYEDRPYYSAGSFRWADPKQRRVRVIQMYYRSEGTWYLSIFCGGGEIFNEVSPYLNEDGRPCCPVELMTAYIDRENRRYGVVRSMISQQEEINKRRSKLLHQLNARQAMIVRGAVTDENELRRQLAAPDGLISIDATAFMDAMAAGTKPFEILPNGDQTAGQFSLLQESKSEIDMFGPNPSLIGQTESGASGRAIMAQQQAGMAELAPIYDSLRDWTIRVYRQMWSRIKQFWTEERWVRVTNTAGQREWVAFNQQQAPVEIINMATGQPMMVPGPMQNAVGEMNIDIIIEDVPDYVTLQQEQFEQLTQMAQQGIPIPPEMIIKASSIKDKGEILEALQQQQQAAMQAQMQQQQTIAQLETMKVQSAAQKDMASAAKSAADAEKIRAETVETMADTEKTRAETVRLIRGY